MTLPRRVFTHLVNRLTASTRPIKVIPMARVQTEITNSALSRCSDSSRRTDTTTRNVPERKNARRISLFIQSQWFALRQRDTGHLRVTLDCPDDLQFRHLHIANPLHKPGAARME